MGIVESRLLAKNIHFACNKAEAEGKHQLDESQLWKDTETVKALKSVYKYLPRDIRQNSRQSAINKAIAHSTQPLEVPQAVQNLQDKSESLFPSCTPKRSEEGSSSSPIGPHMSLLCNVPAALQPSPLVDFYKLLISCEHQQQLGKIRLRICYVVFFRLKNAVQPGNQYQYDDASMFIARLIADSGCVDQLPDIERRVRHWVGLGERYSLIANDLGGLGTLYLLPDKGGESIWTKELPKSSTKPRRVAMLKHLRQMKLPEEAQSRGLHALAECEAAQILTPIKASLFRVMEDQLSEANPRVLGRDQNLNRNAFSGVHPDTPQLCQLSTGTSSPHYGASSTIQIASTLEFPRNFVHTDQLQDARQLNYEHSLAQTSLRYRPDLTSSQVQTNGPELGYMRTESTPCEAPTPHFRNMTTKSTAQCNTERNSQAHFNPMNVTSDQVVMVAPADFPQAFATTPTSVPADYPQLFPFQQPAIAPADYPMMFPCDLSERLISRQ